MIILSQLFVYFYWFPIFQIPKSEVQIIHVKFSFLKDWGYTGPPKPEVPSCRRKFFISNVRGGEGGEGEGGGGHILPESEKS